MNKEEIEKELVRARAVETTIKNEIIELLEQLVEIEKPIEAYCKYGIHLEESSKVGKDIFIDAGGSHLALHEAEDFWHALGKAIAEKKRQQAK